MTKSIFTHLRFVLSVAVLLLAGIVSVDKAILLKNTVGMM